MINFEHITIEGFGSIRDELMFQLNDRNINIVRGRNGSGKTTIFNALMWCLYGVNLKGNIVLSKIPTKKEWQSETFRGTRVRLVLNKDGEQYIIARHIKFKGKTFGLSVSNDLLIYKDDSVLNLQHKNDSQEFIENLLGISSQVFLSSVLFGQRMKRFIEASPVDKRNLFESIFDLGYIDKAKEKAKEKLAEKVSARDVLRTNIETFTNDISLNNRRVSDMTEHIESFQSSISKLLENEIKAREDAQNRLNQLVLKTKLSYKEVLQPEFSTQTLNREYAVQKLTLDNLKFPKPIQDSCNTCGNVLNQTQIKDLESKYNKAHEKYLKDKELCEINLRVLQAELDKTNQFIETQKENVEHNNEVQRVLDFNNHVIKEQANVKSSIEKNDRNIKDLENQKPKYTDADIEALNNNTNQLTELIQKNNLEIDKLELDIEVYIWWSTVGFSAKGLKSYVLDAALMLLNDSVRKYSSRLGLRISFYIDVTKASKPFMTKCFNGDVELDYEEFSGGEKALIDVSTAFAMHDLVCSSVSFNILIMDEIFEGLDTEGIEDVFDLIRMKSEGKSLFIITHSQHIDSRNTKRIEVVRDSKTEPTRIL